MVGMQVSPQSPTYLILGLGTVSALAGGPDCDHGSGGDGTLNYNW